MNAASVFAGLAAAALMAVVLAVIYWPNLRAWWDERIACRHEPRITAGEEHQIRQALALANDACCDPPCSDEDWWICDNHLPRGKHHPPPLRYGPEPIVGRCQWSDEMEERFAE